MTIHACRYQAARGKTPGNGPSRPGSASRAGPATTSLVSPGRHNGGTENVRPIVRDQTTLSVHDRAL